jgi:hypothetical protein
VAASRRHPNRHGSTQLLHRSPDFRRFVDYGITHTSLDRRGMPPVTAVMRRVRRDVEAAFSADNSRDMSEGSTFSNLREVIMTMSEYEERFRRSCTRQSSARGSMSSSSSKHQSA